MYTPHLTLNRILKVSMLLILPFYLFGQTKDLKKNALLIQDSTNVQTKSWFLVKQVADKVWRIDDHGGDNMYLVEGDDKALLIDAGTGVADLSACIKSITALPLVVVNTHGHPDHCGSDYQFPEVYAHRSDFDMIASFCNESFHKDEVKRAEGKFPELAPLLLKQVDDFKMPKLLPVQQGFVFKLGKRDLEVIEVPGHTKGSICLLDAKNKLLFTGDNNNTIVWLFLKDCLPLEIYIQTLQNLKKRSGEFAVLLPGHGDPMDKEFIDEQIICGQNILSSKCKGDPYKTFVDYAKVCSYKRARIAFNPDNLFEQHK
jgi:glyoxylase-like metal-dependent hydrolase (beta-lactamase superfamily II)